MIRLEVAAKGTRDSGGAWTLYEWTGEAYPFTAYFFSDDTLTLAHCGEPDPDPEDFDPATFEGQIDESTPDSLAPFGLTKVEVSR